MVNITRFALILFVVGVWGRPHVTKGWSASQVAYCTNCTAHGLTYLHRTGESVQPSLCINTSGLQKLGTSDYLQIDHFVCPGTHCGLMYLQQRYTELEVNCSHNADLPVIRSNQHRQSKSEEGELRVYRLNNEVFTPTVLEGLTTIGLTYIWNWMW